MLSRRFCRFYPSLSRCYKGQRDYHNDTASIVGSEPDRSSSEFKVGCHLWLFFGASFISSRRSSGRDRVFFLYFLTFFSCVCLWFVILCGGNYQACLFLFMLSCIHALLVISSLEIKIVLRFCRLECPSGTVGW